MKIRDVTAFAVFCAFNLQPCSGQTETLGAAVPPGNIPVQMFLPELKTAATKYQTGTAIVDGQRAEVLARLRKGYDSVIASYEKSAIAGGEIPFVKALAKEREALAKDRLPTADPTEFPKNLVRDRKAYLGSVVKTSAEYEERQQRLDAEYLRFLTSLGTRAAANPELAGQVANQKAVLLQRSASITAGELAKSLEGSTWEGRGRTMMLKRSFNLDGTASTHWDNKKGKWEVVSGKAFTETTGNGETVNWTMSSDLQTITGGDGAAWHRVK